MNYAAQLINNVVTEVIVGTAAWATEHLGGYWVDSATKAGIGWVWDGHELHPPQPPPEPEPES